MTLCRLHIGLCLFAALGISMAAPTPSVAANADSPAVPKADHAPQTGDAATAAKPVRAGKDAKEDRNGKRSGRVFGEKDKAPPTKGDGAAEIRMNDLGAVDTRITVPPLPPRSGYRKQNPLPRTPSGLRTQSPRIRLPGGTVGRNSIGIAIPTSARPTIRGQSQGSARANPAMVTRGGEGAGSTALVPHNAALAPLPTHPIAAAPARPRSTLNGPGVGPRGNAPAMIGGPAKSLAGIDGSAIRSKH